MKIERVKFIPDEMEPETLYISLEFESSSHLCACGCGDKITLPFTINQAKYNQNANDPTYREWFYDDSSVTFDPSILNPCKAHYYIKKGMITDFSK